ncbi:MAG: phosphatase PAP2 family protein [Tannerellaceae bacterium]|jgi:membrane-associated phospholipid phosphatase|nr:phosphatase PAP2 family protein [Tannerellaceae bacterium]
MKRLPLLYTLLFCVLSQVPYAQNDSLSLSHVSQPQSHTGFFSAPASRFILPAAWIAYGALSQVSPTLDRFDHYIYTTSSHRRTKVDDYIQYAPAVAVYGLDFAGIKAKHNFRDRTFVMVSSYIFTAITVHAAKYATQVERPDKSAYNSFPSGHTATAFTGAHILFREYGEASPWIAVAGYATATATGFLRIVNRKHWLSDVVAGAGVGILSVEAGYLLLPVFRRMMGGEQEVTLVPLVGKEMYGLGLSCRF